MLKLHVPYLRPGELDGAVANLLSEYARWKGESVRPPIDVAEIVEGYLGLDFAMTDLRQLLGFPDVLGATWFNLKRVRVDHRLERQEGRYAFTVAHELGHWVLHQPLWLQLTAQAGAVDEQAAMVCRTSQAQLPAEWQADQFAARLLMPGAEVRAALRDATGRTAVFLEGFSPRQRGHAVDERLDNLAFALVVHGPFTNVSKAAMRRRLVDLDLVRDQSRILRRVRFA